MTPIADMLEKMLAKNAPADVIVLAVRTAELSLGLSADKFGARRERERLRKRDYRAKQRDLEGGPKANDVGTTATMSREMSPDNAGQHCNLSSVSSSVLKEETEKKETRAVVVEGRKSARGSRLSPDWQPDEELRQFARDHNVDPDELRAEFVDYWIGVPGQRGCKTDWPATWRNRVRDRQSYRKAKGNGKSIIAAQDRLNDKLREFSEPDLLGGVRGEAGASNVRLLPSR